ncbi:MAG: hypothetical protein JWP88_78 [Flaviaesturariibacter sp.]|nr:hypothetical protein [Flaviaesturariibacter sp.]
MTPTEILHANFLEILFERRNKQYGAYTLRKSYNNRLGVALGISLSAVLLLMFIAGSWERSSAAAFDMEKPDVVIREFESIKEPKLPEPIRPKPMAVPAVSTIQHTNIDIVPDQLVPKPDNTNLNLDNALIGLATKQGVGPVDIATIPPSYGGGGDNIPEAKPAEVPVVAPAINKAPEFPGGQAAWIAFLNRYLRVPDELEAGENKAVSVRFWVSEDGSVTNFQVVKSGGASFDNEVIRVLKKMPRWKPAIQNGQAVATGFTQPVTFTAIEE